MTFEITWQRVPSRIAVHASSEKEAQHIAVEFLLTMMTISEVMVSEALVLLPVDANQN